MFLKLNRIQYPIYNLGPGKRIGIWTQGCSIKCEGCVSSSLWSIKKGKNVEVENLLKILSSDFIGYDGITITGGEPLDQYESLIQLCRGIKENTTLNILIYTGFTIEDLYKKYNKWEIINFVDFILDGPYIKNQHSNTNLKGSENQKFYKKLAGKMVQVEDFYKADNKWSFNLANENVFLSGIPQKNDLQKIVSELNSKGIKIKF
jgi:anaerobic ribonucleoside-triphosphate reductase activating protein